MTTGS